jgi:hypothetical protein
VREEIRKMLAVREAELKSMGDARPTVDLIRTFLTGLSMKFYELLQAALDGNYHSIDVAFFSGSENPRLRARVQKMNTTFAAYMRNFGQTRKIKADTESDNSVLESDNSEDHELAGATAQIAVSKTEMMQWVKEVCTTPTLRGPNLTLNRHIHALEEKNCREIITLRFWLNSFKNSRSVGLVLLNPISITFWRQYLSGSSWQWNG